MPAQLSATERFYGEHPSMRALLALAGRVARSQARTILIYGETGTGKGVLARLLHEQSPRARAPMLDINCAAIPSNLLESELFGHERGAFTGAHSRKPGLIETAQGGTVFLDEIRELDTVMQAKLLTLLDTRRFRRVGGLESVEVDVRFIAATNKILLNEVKAGNFRDDLYYRLQVIALNIPPLRERGEDVLLLAERFLRHYAQVYQIPHKHLHPEVEQIFLRYAWPGNVRELENLIERLCLLEEGDTVEPEHLPARILRSLGKDSLGSATATTSSSSAQAHQSFAAATAQFQCELIRHALFNHHGQLGRAARELGMSRHALRRYILKLKIDVRDAR